MINVPVNIFWFRRDLRLDDNAGLYHALKSGFPVVPIFIFDKNILDELPEDDSRVSFIYDSIKRLNEELNKHDSHLIIEHGDPETIWKKITEELPVQAVFCNNDYEPYAIKRDASVKEYLMKKGIEFYSFKDQVIFEKDEILTSSGGPYHVFTPYSRKWLEKITNKDFEEYTSQKLIGSFAKNGKEQISPLKKFGFKNSKIEVRDYDISDRLIKNYPTDRDIPSIDGTSHLGPHLRFGTISIREVIRKVGLKHEVFIKELVWREFFMQILFHYPKVVHQSFHTKYDKIKWLNREEDFEKWCKGETGYPMVDAGMRELNETGVMHNRVRMITASFLTKHLLIDWRWGESYFAKKLLDYELSSNNGNWQWAAGTGVDAAPYFRVFNPSEQQKKFDPELRYIKKWIPEFGTSRYPDPMIEHKSARERALAAYKKAIN